MWEKGLAGPGLFRLFLASLVFVYHASRFAVGSGAVYVFFTLSGYWIYKMWLARYVKVKSPYVTYVISRLWRLLPTFLLLNVINIGIQLMMGSSIRHMEELAGWPHFLISQILILGYNTIAVKPTVPAWSLDLEVQFYLIAPLLVSILAFSRRSAWLLVGIAAIVSTSSAIWLGSEWLSSFIVFFFLGMVAAKEEWRPSGRLALYCSAAAVAVVIVIGLTPYRAIIFVGAHRTALSFLNTHLNVALAVLAAPFAIYTTTQTGFKRDGMFADLSYIVYLLHWGGVKCLPLHTRLGIPRLPFTLVVVVGVYALSILIWKWYDKPINRRRAKWVSNRRALPKMNQVSPAVEALHK